ncbi:MAG: hypothetical protein ACRDDY_00620 [Clostridium sp.]|uniref:hypothetical protein n=1 Tax=Clostridium sp. TaxID=1506 RepID=UPI003EE7F1EE
MFYEQFLTKDYGPKVQNMSVARSTMIVLAILSPFTIGIIGSLIFGSLYLALGIVENKMFLEYEYELTEGELVVSKIMSKRRRKVVGTIEVSKVIDIVTTEECKRRGTKVINAALEKNSEKVILVSSGKQMVGYKMTMDRKLISICKNINSIGFTKA